MEQASLKVCLTGAAGQIGYAILPLICTGQVFGPDRHIVLTLLDIERMVPALKGVVMELNDCAYPLLDDIQYGCDPKEMFKDIDVGLFIGGFPRLKGMERKDLLAKNCGIFKEQGMALNEVAKETCKCLVVANPANTNCLTLSKYAPKIPKKNFSALTRLDHNRAKAQLAGKADVKVPEVHNPIIWGNHSGTQFPDVAHGTISGKPITEVITDMEYLKGEFISKVQKRGAEIIEAKGSSSVFSAANAAKDHMNSWIFGTKEGEWVSMAVITEDSPYGIENNLCFSFPCKCKDFTYEIIPGLEWNDFAKEKIKVTENELKEEREEADKH